MQDFVHSRQRQMFFNRLLNLEKRLVLIALAIFVGFVAFNGGNNNQITGPGYTSPITKSTKLIDEVKKIKGNDNWKPTGVGSSEEILGMPHISAGGVVNLDSGEVLWSKNLTSKIAPASLAKVATVMTALDISELSKTITVSSVAADQIPTKLGLKANEKLTLEEAISAAILTSANDATEAIADYLGREVGTGREDFMILVNEKVKKIGAVNSNFVSPTGLDSGEQYSTISDLAIIAHEAKINYPFIAKIGATQYIRLLPNSNHKRFDLPNWNALLGTYEGVDGLKIGYTENAGHATMVTANREGKKLVAIVIGAKSLEARELAAASLLNYGFGEYGISEIPLESLDLVSRFEDWRRQLTAIDFDDSENEQGGGN